MQFDKALLPAHGTYTHVAGLLAPTRASCVVGMQVLWTADDGCAAVYAAGLWQGLLACKICRLLAVSGQIICARVCAILGCVCAFSHKQLSRPGISGLCLIT